MLLPAVAPQSGFQFIVVDNLRLAAQQQGMPAAVVTEIHRRIGICPDVFYLVAGQSRRKIHKKILAVAGKQIRRIGELFFVSWIGEPRSELAKTLGVKVDSKGSIVTNHRGKTNIEGVWAAGDVRPMTQAVATAVGSGVYAGLMITHFLLDQS